MRLTYAERKALGLCSKCSNLVVPGKSRCERCLAMQRDVQAARNGRCALENLCRSCAKVPPVNGFYCKTCKTAMRESWVRSEARPEAMIRDQQRYLRIRQERLATGLCTACGVSASRPGYTRCDDCNLYKRNYEQENRQRWRCEGLCTNCGHVRDRTGLTCSVCLVRVAKAQANRYRQRVEAGLCLDCDQPAENGKRRCQSCLQISNAYRLDYYHRQTSGAQTA